MRSRLARLGLVAAIALPLVAVLALVFSDGEVAADLENNNSVYTSPSGRLRMIVPRGWRATDQPSYPGLLLWMMRSQPEGQLVLTAEAFTRDLYCSWPIACRANHDATPVEKYACALRDRLAREHFRVGPTQPGPKDTEAGGLPSVWFELDDGKHFLRQAIAMTNDRAISLVLTTSSNDARSAHSRAFEQALRTLHVLSTAEMRQRTASSTSSTSATSTAIDAGPIDGTGTIRLDLDAGMIISDAGIADAPTTLDDAAVIDGGVTFESAPAPAIDPVGPCR